MIQMADYSALKNVTDSSLVKKFKTLELLCSWPSSLQQWVLILPLEYSVVLFQKCCCGGEEKAVFFHRHISNAFQRLSTFTHGECDSLLSSTHHLWPL